VRERPKIAGETHHNPPGARSAMLCVRNAITPFRVIAAAQTDIATAVPRGASPRSRSQATGIRTDV
jgi:hypothetical protein